MCVLVLVASRPSSSYLQLKFLTYPCWIKINATFLFLVFNRFCTKGGIALKSFQEMYKMFFPGGDADSFAEHVYKSMDKNLDGTVDFREFAQMLSVSKKGTQDEKIKMAFHMYDIDKNGLELVFSHVFVIRSAIDI